jgi:hypothetical protein
MITNEAFYKPVAVTAGQGNQRHISSLSEMHDFLAGWPCVRFSPSYEVARRACSAARAGHLTVEQARRALATFAQSPECSQSNASPSRRPQSKAEALTAG